MTVKQEKGFTLVELLISLTILAFIGYFTSESMRTSTQRSQKIRDNIELSREVKAAARVIKGDISRAYNARDIYIAVYNEAQRERVREWQRNQQNPQQNQNANNSNDPDDPNNPNPPQGDENNNSQGEAQQGNQTPPPPYEPRTELVVTHFLGEKDKIDLATISGVQIRKNVKASDLIEVGYYLQDCRRRAKRDETTRCLWRRISYYLDGEVNVGGESSVLLEDVTKFELKYLRFRGEEVEWIDRWLSDQNGDDMTRDALPLAVQLELEVERALDKQGENKQRLNTITYIPINFTNNNNVKNIIQMNSQGNPYENPMSSALGNWPGGGTQPNNPQPQPTNPPQQRGF